MRGGLDEAVCVSSKASWLVPRRPVPQGQAIVRQTITSWQMVARPSMIKLAQSIVVWQSAQTCGVRSGLIAIGDFISSDMEN